jgi:phasin family protein
MTQAKKTTGSSAKLASAVASKAAKTTYAAVESSRNSAENVVKLGSRAAKDFLQTSAGEAQKAQDKILAMSRDGAEKFAQSADVATKALYEAINTTRDNIEAAVECGNAASALAKEVSSELVEYANKSFAESVEVSKEIFACRTINDIMELQNRVLKNAMDNAFAQSSRLSNMFFEYSTEALEPINERVAQATEQFSKTLKTA